MPNLRPIRRNQLISPFGIGAMVDFRGDESLMTAGLDEWPLARDECPSDWLVREERLEAKLGVTHFRLPPEHREPGQGIQYANQFIPYVRFPRWHYCPRRGAMEFLPLYGGREKCRCRPGLDCFSTPERRRPYLIPMRFVAVCPKGHIEDFPFMEWVHRTGSWDESHKLRMLAGRSSASLSGIKIACNCGKTESMTGSFNFDRDSGGALHRIGHDCAGHMPWIGRTGESSGSCGEYLRVLQRGASNVYFPLTHSSIYIPLWGEGASRSINKLLEMPKVWESLIAGLDEGKFVQKVRCEVIGMNYHVDPEELRSAAQRKLDGDTDETNQPKTEDEFRRQEYEALREARGGETTALQVEIRNATEYGEQFAILFDRICLVRKLRETRVLAGFSRLLPVDDVSNAEVLPVAESDTISWLPATVVYGEGLFLQFNTQRLRDWLSTPGVGERIAELSQHYNQRRLERGLAARIISPKYVLLHTFAHLLITQLAFDCGYGSASLRERIYCDIDDPRRPMQGILIYTASGDSEGTLGGLVRQGEPDRLPAIIFRALSRAQWCSSDPVCIESTGQGSDNANLAACHGCVLVPETSCEQGNRLLDRGIIIGTPSQPSAGYFSSVDAVPA
jgi:hypothetical protein